MLRVIQNQNAKSAQQYYSQADYYSEGQELVGQWGGLAAKQLGLEGTVDKLSFDRLCENLHPLHGEQLTPRTRTDRTVGYDFNFHAPKSASVVYALTRDDRILDAFRESVQDAMQLLEQDTKTRVRKRGVMSERTTGNLAWAEFVHFTARPVNGEPDPHLHAHNFVFNATWDDAEHQWKAAQFRDLKRDAPFYEAAFHAAFAERLRHLGYDITRQQKAWEITGIDQQVIKTFSRRTALIEELARHEGIVDPKVKDQLGTKTREKKAKNLSTHELRVAWRERLTPEQNEAVQVVYQAAREGMVAEPTVTAKEALDHAIAHSFEQQSVVPTRKILETALRFGVGDVSLNDLEKELPHSGLLIRDWDGRSMATTKEVLAEEKQLLDFARTGKATRLPLNSAWPIQRTWLNAGQQSAVQQLLSSPDRVQLLIGKFGTGKTSLMQETVEAIQAGGKQVLTLAPSAEASRGVLRKEGFESADTVARFLMDEKLQHSMQDQVLWIDEAGLLGTKTLAHVFDIAEKNNIRLVLSGDWGQHGSVERGSALRLLETDAGLKPAVLKDIVRQQGEYRSATMLLAEGKTLDGFNALDQLGWVEELPTGEREQRVADEYLISLNKNEKLLVVCPTHAEGEACTAAIRHTLQVAGKLGTDEHEFLRLEPKHLTEAERSDPVNYEPGDVLVLMQNAPGYQKGTRLAYSSSLNADLKKLAPKSQVFRQEKIALAVGDRIRLTAGGTSHDGHRLNNGTTYTVAGFTKARNIVLDNGWKLPGEWGLIDRAFVSTSHASQGRTEDRVILCQSALSWGAASQEQFHVSASRGKKSCLILCDDKDDLRRQIARSEQKLSATEFVRTAKPSPKLQRTRFLTRLADYARTVKDHLFPQQHHQTDRRNTHAR